MMAFSMDDPNLCLPSLNPMSRPFAPRPTKAPSKRALSLGDGGNFSNNNNDVYNEGHDEGHASRSSSTSSDSPMSAPPSATLSVSSGLGHSDSAASSSPPTMESHLAMMVDHETESIGKSVFGSALPSLPADDRFGLRGLLRSIEGLKTGKRMIGLKEATAASLGWSEETRRRCGPSPYYRHVDSVLSDHPSGFLAGPHCDMGSAMPEEYKLHERRGADVPRLVSPDKLHWPTDLLFYFFYVAVGDGMQMYAANQLYKKGWRFSKTNGIWIARYPSQPPVYRTNQCERGIFQYFEPKSWSRMSAHITVVYEDLEGQVFPPENTEQIIMGLFQQQQQQVRGGIGASYSRNVAQKQQPQLLHPNALIQQHCSSSSGGHERPNDYPSLTNMQAWAMNQFNNSTRPF